MKKLRAMYKGYMLHPILYKTVTRTSIVAVLMLLWERYVSDGTFSMWEAPGFLCGVVLLIWAWVDYLRPPARRVQGDQAAEKVPCHPLHHGLCRREDRLL